MKGKALAILAIALLASCAFALESGPSNPVGFYTVTVTHPAGAVGYNLVSFPTLPTDASLANTLGAQLPGGAFSGNSTNIKWLDGATGNFLTSYKTASGTGWSGAIASLESRKGYYVITRSTAATSINVVVAGDVRTASSWDMGTIYTGYNMVGSVWAAPQTFAASNIYSGATRFTGAAFSGSSDWIRRLSGGSFQNAWYHTTNGWQGVFNSFEPGTGYYVLRRTGRAAYAWPDYPRPAGTTTDSYVGNNAPVVTPVSTVVLPAKSVANPAVDAPVKSTRRAANSDAAK